MIHPWKGSVNYLKLRVAYRPWDHPNFRVIISKESRILIVKESGYKIQKNIILVKEEIPWSRWPQMTLEWPGEFWSKIPVICVTWTSQLWPKLPDYDREMSPFLRWCRWLSDAHYLRETENNLCFLWRTMMRAMKKKINSGSYVKSTLTSSGYHNPLVTTSM